jgi:hypothetical protein
MKPITRIMVECLRVYSTVEFSGSDELFTKDHETSSFVTYFYKITKPLLLKPTYLSFFCQEKVQPYIFFLFNFEVL